MRQSDTPRQILACLLRPGDRIVTADMIRATVTAIDGRDPKTGRWVECRTDDGREMRFASSPNLVVTRLSVNRVLQEDGALTTGRVA